MDLKREIDVLTLYTLTSEEFSDALGKRDNRRWENGYSPGLPGVQATVLQQPAGVPVTFHAENKTGRQWNMRESKNKVHFMTQAAMIAALYTALTAAFAPVAYGPVQFRISEALCVLPFFTSAAVPGLFLGCAISNGMGVALGTAVLPDVVFGSLATLIGAAGSYAVRKDKRLVCIPPVLSNTIIIPWVLRYAYGAPEMIPFMMLTVGIGEILAAGVLGNLLLAALERYRGLVFKRAPDE